MDCPVCGEPNTITLESRNYRGGMMKRRRRECTMCFSRFTTYEVYKEDFDWLEKIESQALKFTSSIMPSKKKTAREGADKNVY